MKVAIVAGPHYPIPPAKYGGTETVIYYLIKGLKELGHEPILLGPADSKVDCQIIPTVRKSIAFPVSRTDLPRFQKKIARINAKTEELLKKVARKVDVIHSHGFDLLKFQKYPNLTTLHARITLEDLDYYEQRKDLYYVSISKNQQHTVPDLQYMGVVYNGEDPSEFPIINEPEDYLCFIGRFDRDKQPHLAIQLAIKLGMKIKVAGKLDHEGYGYFEEEVKRYFDHPLVEYLGEVNFEQKVELMGKARCNLHPISFREPFGLTVIEAAYMGTPTLAIKRGSMRELIEQGRTGQLVEDFVEGYHKIGECFAMDRHYVAKRARSLFNYKTMTRQYLAAYQAVIESVQARKKEESLLSALTRRAREELESIWRTGY